MSVVVCPSAGTWPTAFEFLCERFPHVPAAQWRERFERGEVCDDVTQTALTLNVPFHAQQRLRYARDVPDEPTIPFAHRVLFQDELIVVADKPHFLPTTPSGRYVRETLLTRLQRELNLSTLAPVHRIDQDTAGVVLFCVRPQDRGAYQRLFATREIEKRYEALAPTREDIPKEISLRLESAPHFMQMQVATGAPNAETEISLIRTYGATSHYALRPRTGQRHQLRVTMAHVGAPIVNDRIYPTLQPLLDVAQFSETPPLQLIARSLAFTDPITHAPREFHSTFSLALPSA
jgi:tRNA pseudouridine32 synthase / 23S rRNA pseudouridine746 synthase